MMPFFRFEWKGRGRHAPMPRKPGLNGQTQRGARMQVPKEYGQ
jgi:hypothetical protein